MGERKKRIKYVYRSSSEVIHLWANQAQDSARYSVSCSFEGTSLYSYQTRIGEIGSYNGQKVVILSKYRYSNTTAKHLSRAEHAFPEGTIILKRDSYNFDKNHIEAALLEEQDLVINEFFSGFSRLSVRSYNVQYELDTDGKWNFLGLAKVFNDKAKKLGFSHLCIEPDKELWDLRIAHLEDRQKRCAELEVGSEDRAKKRREERLLKEQKSIEEKTKDWLAGKTIVGSLHNLKPQLVRVKKGNEVETTGGARVSLLEAHAFLKALEAGNISEGAKIGPFTFTSLEGDALTIGCHTLSLSQCKAVVFGGAK